jgi:outer membrane lipoprotein-sorting protein
MTLPETAIALLFLSVVSTSAQQAARDEKPVKTAAEAFKNVQVLKRVPADQWFDTMAFIAGSLGVTCDHCHTSSFELDEGNAAKLKARQMMRMVDEINANNFDGKIVVTCNTCHRGTLKPQAAPVPDAEHWKKAAQKASTLPAAADLIARYRHSVGGGRSAPSQSVTFDMETYGGKGPARQTSVEVLLDGPARVREIDREGATVKTLIKNGHKAWANEKGVWREMNEGEASSAMEAAGIIDPDQVGEVTPSGAVFEDRVYGQRAFVVPVQSKDDRKWLYFDAVTGLLLRQRILSASFYGDESVDIEYSDYRKFGSIQLPNTFYVVNAGGSGLTIRRAVSRKINIEVKDAQFTKEGD